uniref:Uncharacterized protein n=1 Tax=Accipiter nisus TaxID=211598 RepID=A0A8B9P149_9AVES
MLLIRLSVSLFSRLENINPEENDMTLQELLNRINNADTGIDILKNGAIILNRIHRTKERRKKIIAEEMNAVIEQRDAALSQCKRLEQELHHLKEQNQTSANNTRHLTAENNQERALKGSQLELGGGIISLVNKNKNEQRGGRGSEKGQCKVTGYCCFEKRKL